jgi:hypothetical protein
MNKQQAKSLGWLAFGLTVACVPLTVWMLSRPLPKPLAAQSIWATAVSFVGALAFAAVGALIVARHPRHAIGWLFSLSGLATAVAVVLAAYGEISLTKGSSLQYGELARNVSHVLIQGGLFIPLTLGLLLFPDGHLLSWRWWPAAAAAFLGLVLRLYGDSSPATGSALIDIGDVGVLFTVGSAFAGLASLAVRWRRAGPVLRQQIKWMAAAAVVVVIAFIGDIVVNVINPHLIENDAEFLVFALTYTCVPIAAGASILRYRLYEIDLIINRAIVYLALTAILAGLYAGFTATLQRLFVQLTGQSSDAAIIITVALIATLFTPVRNALQRLVDTRFKDARDLERLMESLETDVGSVMDVIVHERLAERLVRTARDGADARGAALFLNGAPDAMPTFTAGEWTGEPELVVPLRVGNHEIGRMALGPRRNGAPYAARERDHLQRAADIVAVGLTLAREQQPTGTLIP